MKGKNYKIVSLYSFFPFQENLILDLKNKLLEIENENDLSGLLIFASEGINGTICAEKNVIDFVINLLNKFAGNRDLNIKVNFSKEKVFKKLKIKIKKEIDSIEMIRMIATARILMPKSKIRLSAGREKLSKEAQILCFQCGANSIFYGDELLTTSNPSFQSDRKLLKEVGVSFNKDFENCEKTLSSL